MSFVCRRVDLVVCVHASNVSFFFASLSGVDLRIADESLPVSNLDQCSSSSSPVVSVTI